MRTPVAERIYKSLWHLALVGVGIYEYNTHKSRLAKALSLGIIAFHVDAVITDALGLEHCLSRRVLDSVLEAKHERKDESSRSTKRSRPKHPRH
jgi:hypothetical protein